MCHRRQTFRESSVRSVSLPDDPSMRASDAERERVVEALRRHATAGRLSVAELEERSASAYAARTLAELAPLLADLPEPSPLRSGPRSVARPRAIRQLALVAVMLIAIWAATGFGYFWPLWPILGMFWFGGRGALGWGALCSGRRGGLGRPAPWSSPGRFDL
jgi:Domain of unknown function (DUF1707)